MIRQIIDRKVKLKIKTSNCRKLSGRQSPAYIEKVHQNMEDITLVWFDKNIDVRTDTIQTRKMLREINDYVIFHRQLDECVEYIKSIENQKIFFVTSGACAESILPLVQKIRQIDSIFIFCMRKSKYEHLMDEYTEIIGIYTTQDELVSSILENVHLIEKNLQTFSFYDQQQKLTRDLTKEAASFFRFQLFIKAMLNMPKTSESKQEMVSKCQEYYRGNNKELKFIQEFNKTYKSTDCIRWYTKQCFLYKLINKALRTEDIKQLYTFRFFIVDLCTSLAQQYRQIRDSSIVHLYRGVKVSNDESEMLKSSIDRLVSINGFLSTTRSRHLALNFATKPTKRMDIVPVLFEIEVDRTQTTTVFADISEWSDYPQEQEVLFDVGAVFEISNVKVNEEQHVWIIKMKAINKGLEWIQISRKELEQLCTPQGTGKLCELTLSFTTSMDIAHDRRFVIAGLNSDEFTSIIEKLKKHTEHLIIQIDTFKEFEAYVNSNTNMKITMFMGNQQFLYFSSIIQDVDAIEHVYVLVDQSDKHSTEPNSNSKVELKFSSVNDLLSELVDQLANEYLEKAEFLEKKGEINLANEKHDIGQKIYEIWMNHDVQPSEYKPSQCATMGQLSFLLFQTNAADQALIIKEKFELATGTILFSTSSENRCLEYLQLNATKNFLIIVCGNDLPETISNFARHFPQIYAIYPFGVNNVLGTSEKIRGVFKNENNLFYQLTNDIIDYYTHEADVYMRLAQHKLSGDKYQEAFKWATILDQMLKNSL
ncbi:unnamed protein product [Didymodactylos carnosus]|uniref:ADP ribosyltransferase domain-containing protein n=1 Tax=Didymodactylos carnosus TaxID=1234261 RepID=A0A813SRE4_9BILA|nr:unnamed protein product [Didymodactylos carnosus]CAF0954530.1 unnamed protein product [Didymodactylos carnosus]CAF3585701.1 unnamed protein product [Didymodactylos carnosus]CAF3728038.1 unnamed protein product [Didymodactylos carnosus]